MVLFSIGLVSSLFASTVSAALVKPLASRAPAPFTDFNNNDVFHPGADYTSWRTIYGRSLQLSDGSFLVTWENYPPEPPQVAFPIYKSTDGGATWSSFSTVDDQVNGWGLRYQPNLFTLPQEFGDYPIGTIVLGGVSTPTDLSEAYIELYASRDNGVSWEFVSHIAYGAGPETTPNGNKAVWEPFFMVYDNQLVCFYSDQRDSAHAQKLVHVTTNDLKSWSDPVDDVADPVYDARPGMTTVAHIESTDNYIMTYENCGPASCEVHYKVSSSPLAFANVEGTGLVSTDGTIPYGSPYVIWTPHPDRTDGSGIIIANGNSEEAVFLNEDAADASGWRTVNVGQWSAYSRALRIIDIQGQKKLMLTNGGNMGDGANNWVAVGVVPIPT